MGMTWTLAWTGRAKVTLFSELLEHQLSLVYDATLAHPASAKRLSPNNNVKMLCGSVLKARAECTLARCLCVRCVQLPRAQFVCVAVCMPCLHIVFWCRWEFVHTTYLPYTLPPRRRIYRLQCSLPRYQSLKRRRATWSVRTWAFNADSMT